MDLPVAHLESAAPVPTGPLQVGAAPTGVYLGRTSALAAATAVRRALAARERGELPDNQSTCTLEQLAALLESAEAS